MKLEKEVRAEYATMQEVCKLTGHTNDEVFVGYIRQPLYFTLHANDTITVRGVCAYDYKRCTYTAPHSCNDCSRNTYKILKEE